MTQAARRGEKIAECTTASSGYRSNGKMVQGMAYQIPSKEMPCPSIRKAITHQTRATIRTRRFRPRARVLRKRSWGIVQQFP